MEPALHRIAPASALTVILLCFLSVAALLAELYQLASMSVFVPFITVPALVGLGFIGARAKNRELRLRIRVGAVAGLLATLGYDLVRIPLALLGRRIFAPIYSYGLLIEGGGMSSGLTDLIGWLFHFSNGITFGIAYTVVAARRHWGWGLLYGVLLETAAYASPFTHVYGLSGQAGVIAIAYLAHLAYGWPLGRITQNIDTVGDWLPTGRPVTTMLATTVLVLAVWHAPWSTSVVENDARDLAAASREPVAIVVVDRFTPEWLRVEPGGCIMLVSRSDRAFDEANGSLSPGKTALWCFDEEQIHRVRLGEAAYSGGFVISWPR